MISIMSMAPLPLFAAYGRLTAVMILLALTAPVVVLPSLLVLVAPDLKPEITGVVVGERLQRRNDKA